jgi:hypothetical protein
VRRGKGQKDVRTMLPVAVRDRLRVHLEEVKRQHEGDLARGVGRAVLPFALDRKYQRASTDWAWQFVFPAARITGDAEEIRRASEPGELDQHGLPRSAMGSTLAVSSARVCGPKGGWGGRAPGGAHQACRSARFSSLICDSSPRRWLRHSHRAGTARASRRQHHDDLFARPQSGGDGGPQPSRSAVRNGRCRALARVARGLFMHRATPRCRPQPRNGQVPFFL